MDGTLLPLAPRRSPSRFITSATTSFTSACFITHSLAFRLERGFARLFVRVDDAHDHGLGGQLYRLCGHPRAAALHDQYKLTVAGADDVNGDDRAAGVAERRGLLSGVVVLDVEGFDDQQLLAAERLVLLRRDDVASYTCEKHGAPLNDE